MESVLFEACRLLDVPAQDWQMLSREGSVVPVYTPVLEAYCRFRQPLLLAAAAPTVKAEGPTQRIKEEDQAADKRSRL
eukprot:10871395-Alexandrium_andersonii.AAC.1